MLGAPLVGVGHSLSERMRLFDQVLGEAKLCYAFASLVEHNL